MKAYALKAIIRETNADLNRIGRSRNWQLKATFEQLEQIISTVEHANEPSWLWMVMLLKSQYKNLSHDALMDIAKRTKNITVSQLMAKTDCTIIQARKVIDEIEWQ